MHGLLIVDKPAGITSTDVLRVLRRRLRVRKLGHAGTLDPFATGVLPVLLGQATRLVPFVQGGDKIYRACVHLGVSTDTLDRDGELTGTFPLPEQLDQALLEREVLPALRGVVELPVPAHAAVKVDGERLYTKARRGEEVERPLRRMRIERLELEALAPPRLDLLVRCGSGTYVRSIAEAIGAKLGCGAHLETLRRLAVGPFEVAAAVELEDLDELSVQRHLLSPAEALPDLPTVLLEPEQVRRVLCGQKLGAATVPPGAATEQQLRLLSAQGELVAVAEVLPERRGLKVLRAFPS